MSQQSNLYISPAPHIWQGLSVKRIMYTVVLALLLPTAGAVYFFGYYTMSVIAVSIVAAVLTEYLAKKLRKRQFVMDWSAVITGLLLALTLPPTIPLWMAALGSIFAIGIVKEAFGGLGHNIFNPALGGRAFLTASFSARMTTWILPTGFGFDAVTSATPLNNNFVWAGDRLSLYRTLFFGNHAGSIGETSALLTLAGGILLLVLGMINWRTPAAYIGTVAVMSFAFGQDALFNVLAGGLLLGAFFMATDYVTTPITNNGRIIFGVGAGILTAAIRLFGGMPEGVCYSILLMNAVTPLIDRYVRVKPYGLKKEGKREA
ncbi:MAG: RnfABCDGE type electron transport complex subunit D [Dehalococcoidales bacterium]|nr:RnfABCDGE type electron transport complex subunit D [Dehalococcoidales bacterium]